MERIYDMEDPAFWASYEEFMRTPIEATETEQLEKIAAFVKEEADAE